MATNTNKVGFIWGIDSLLIKKFEVGFVDRVKNVNTEVREFRYAATFLNISRGYEISKFIFGDGVDMLYYVVGDMGIGIFRDLKETGNYCIGLDQN